MTHDATEDDDGQTDVIYMLLMTEPSNYDIESQENVSIPQRRRKTTLNIEILIVNNRLEYYSG